MRANSEACTTWVMCRRALGDVSALRPGHLRRRDPTAVRGQAGGPIRSHTFRATSIQAGLVQPTGRRKNKGKTSAVLVAVALSDTV